MFVFTFAPADDKVDQHTVEADSRDVLRWEKAKNGRSAAKLLAEPNLIDSYILCYLAARRQELVDCSPNEFEEKYILLYGQDVKVPDPTQPAP
jgi:hypothetical protein